MPASGSARSSASRGRSRSPSGPPPRGRSWPSPSSRRLRRATRCATRRAPFSTPPPPGRTERPPTLQFGKDTQTREFILSGMGEIHLEVAVEKLRRQFGVEVELRTPKIPYKETIKGTAEAQGKYKKQPGGRGQYGDCWLRVEPLPPAAGFEFVNAIVGGVIPRQYIPAVEKGVVERMSKGVVAGYPVVDAKVTVFDGSFHTVDSSEVGVQI